MVVTASRDIFFVGMCLSRCTPVTRDGWQYFKQFLRGRLVRTVDTDMK